MRVLKMSAADPEIHSWVNRAGGEVFISGFMVTLTYVMDLRWGVGQEKRPKGLPSISGPARPKHLAPSDLEWGVGGGAPSVYWRALTILRNRILSHYPFTKKFPSSDRHLKVPCSWVSLGKFYPLLLPLGELPSDGFSGTTGFVFKWEAGKGGGKGWTLF